MNIYPTSGRICAPVRPMILGGKFGLIVACEFVGSVELVGRSSTM